MFRICFGNNELLACQCGERNESRNRHLQKRAAQFQPLVYIHPSLNIQLLEAACCISFVVVHEERHQRKQLRDEDEQPQSMKRRKAAFSSGYPPQFWDTLSKVRLTRRALREIDRRSAQSRSAPVMNVTGTATSRRILRSDSHRLEKFAKDGGPDLSTLRGVSTRLSIVVDGIRHADIIFSIPSYQRQQS